MVCERVEDQSTDASMEQPEGFKDSIKFVMRNGDNGDMNTPSSPMSTSRDGNEDVEVGMQCVVKNLYSGKEDKRGRFQWQETIPEDIGKPVENAETAKFALLVRNVKVYNDPRRT